MGNASLTSGFLRLAQIMLYKNQYSVVCLGWVTRRGVDWHTLHPVNN